MKFILTFKTPNVLDQIKEIIEDTTNNEIDEINKILDTYLRYSEYLDVEFDTATDKVKVIPK